MINIRQPSAAVGVERAVLVQGLKTGFTLIELMITLTIIGLLAGITIPSVIKYRSMAQVKTCMSNLRNLDHAKQQWAFDQRKVADEVPSMAEVLPYLQFGKQPECPADGTYHVRRVSKIPTCTLYPVGHTMNTGNLEDDAAPD